MGGTVPGIALFVWSLTGSPPHWTVSLILVGALLSSAYFAWHDEYLAKLEGLLHLRIKISEIAIYDTLGFVEIVATVFNAGPPTIIEDWVLEFPNGLRASSSPRDVDKTLLLPVERIGYQNVAKIAEQPLETGGRREVRLDFFPRLSKDEIKAFRDDGLVWSVSYSDATGRHHNTKFIKRNGRKAELIADFVVARD